MPNTYVKIATVTVGGATAANMTFSSIPQNYTDLKVSVSARCDAASNGQQFFLAPNGVTTLSNNRLLFGSGSAAGSANNATTNLGFTNGSQTTASTFGSADIYIPNYSNTTANKSITSDTVEENNATAAYMGMSASLWSSTSAITSLVLLPNSGSSNFVQYSTATLYGISKS